MSDWFSGSVYIGGAVTETQMAKIEKLCDGHTDGEFCDVGHASFQECTQDNFLALVDYCKSENIALCLQWDAKYEFNGQLEYWLDGKSRDYLSTKEGDICIRLADLRENENLLIKDYIAKLNIPDFPEFVLVQAVGNGE